MAARPPLFCRLSAWALLHEQTGRLDSTAGLLAGAVAIAMHDMPDATPQLASAALDRLAERVRRRVRSKDPQALLAHAHSVLFDEDGFAGNIDDYDDPYNSYVPAVLERKRGLPITLALVYKCVLERLELSVQGINAPGHFLARVQVGNELLIVDPFFAGRVLSREEAFARIEQAIGRSVQRSDEVLPVASHGQWLARMLRNLQGVFERRGDENRLAAMGELAILLQGA